MSAANNLEALINLEQNLKSQYEQKLTVETQKVKQAESNNTTLKATIEKQLTQITQLSAGRVESKRLEQESREMKNRVGNLQKEIDSLRTKAKNTQKELIEARATIKTLKQLDAEKLKKNLISSKGKLLEQRTANEVLNKKNKTLKIENSELVQSNEKLQKELEELKPQEPEETKTDDQALNEAEESKIAAKKTSENVEDELEAVS